MKKIACFVLLAVVCGASAMDANLMKYQQLIEPVASAATEAVTSTVSLVHATTSTGTYSVVTNLAGTACTVSQTGPATSAVQTVQIDTARLHSYVKVIVAQATTNEIPAVSALLVAPMKSE